MMIETFYFIAGMIWIIGSIIWFAIDNLVGGGIYFGIGLINLGIGVYHLTS